MAPFSKNSFCSATMASMTLIMVRRRCSMVLMIHSAWRFFSSMNLTSSSLRFVLPS